MCVHYRPGITASHTYITQQVGGNYFGLDEEAFSERREELSSLRTLELDGHACTGLALGSCHGLAIANQRVYAFGSAFLGVRDVDVSEEPIVRA